MAITCCLCERKQSGWIKDFSLNKKMPNYRICVQCNENLEKLKEAERFEDEKEAFDYIKNIYINNNLPEDIKEYLHVIINSSNQTELEDCLSDKEKKYKEESKKKINQLMMTTGYNFEGYKIVKYHDVISSEVVLGTGFFKSIGAGLSNVLGTESEALGEKFTEAKKKTLIDIKEQAVKLGANAVIGVDIDYATIADSMIAVIVNGTAVTIKNID